MSTPKTPTTHTIPLNKLHKRIPKHMNQARMKTATPVTHEPEELSIDDSNIQDITDIPDLENLEDVSDISDVPDVPDVPAAPSEPIKIIEG